MYYYVNKMKKIIPVILLVLSLAGCYNSGEPRERILKIYNWADYIGADGGEYPYRLSDIRHQRNHVDKDRERP